MSEPLTIVFWPESAAGPTNNCIGIGNVLLQRGHRVVFAVESSWDGTLDALGFEEHLVDLAEPPEGPVDAGQFWKDFISETAPEFRKPTIEQLETVTAPIWKSLIDGAVYSQDRLASILDDVRPDVIVEDNVVCFPALLTAGAPFVRLVSCNPLEIKDPLLPPPFSGLPTADPSGWDDFRAAYERTHRDMWERFNTWVVEQGAPALDDLEFIHTSGHLNLYLYPQSVDYQRSRALPPTWQRVDSSVRTTDEPFQLPPELADGDGALVYLSLGSLGSADVELMQRLVDVLSTTPHRFVVSKGPRHDEIELADNMWGAEVVPQTNVLPLMDLVITHGGNNTVTESLHFGKPMVLLPLFWDQYDNAQRIHETGAGVRLDTYGFADDELTGAVDRLLADHALRERLRLDGERIRSVEGTAVAADRIEAVARSHRGT
jgi:MGT family glycosyltransferase